MHETTYNFNGSMCGAERDDLALGTVLGRIVRAAFDLRANLAVDIGRKAIIIKTNAPMTLEVDALIRAACDDYSVAVIASYDASKGG